MGLRPGDIIDGRFQTQELIGYGGQGVVLKVVHLEWDRELAMKLPLPEVVSSPSKRERFLQEAETWIRLGAHPHIVRCWFVHKVVGLPALFLDLIQGGSLEDQLKSGAIGPGNWSTILKTLLQVSEGLAHSHSMGVVHRDIKPENLLIHSNGQIGVTDFGLVKSINNPERHPPVPSEGEGPASGKQDPGITGTRQFLGTPRYGAPEQWNKSMTIGPTTDIYALGVIMYEMLCGRRPFDRPNEMVDVLELIQRHLYQEPNDPRRYYSDIPEELATLTLQCLKKDPAERPQTMNELITRLSGSLNELCGETHESPKPVPGGDRADLLNNAAYSLYSLGKVDNARTLLQRGLMLEAGHPECLYNLVQLDRREGRISPPESLWRLRRANANYQLALLLIEEGLGKIAIELIESMPESEKNGLIYRTQGDALMYAKQYLAAQRAYEKAQLTMPGDQPTRLRKLLATQGLRGLEGHVFFPSTISCYKNKAPDGDLMLVLSTDSQVLIGLNSKEVVLFHIDSESVKAIVSRPPEAQEIQEVWVSSDRLLLQDSTSYELWDIAELNLLQRTPGRVLAASPDLGRLVLLQRDGVIYVDRASNTMGPVQFPPGTRPGNVRAAFNTDYSALYFLTPSGTIGQMNSNFQVVPLNWPPRWPSHETVNKFIVDPSGRLFTIHSDGLFQGGDLAQQKPLFSLKLPFVPQNLQIDRRGLTLVVDSPTHHGLFDGNGELLYRGSGPFSLDSKGRYGLSWANGSLTLFELHPLRRVRSWSERTPVPKSIHIAADGRRATSLQNTGHHYVWEVDEENRVYEHNLLLTPGQSYKDLIEGYDLFKEHFANALRLYKKKQYFRSYQALKYARAIKGFSQAYEVLELHRELSRRLRRGKLDALWERFNLINISAVALTSQPTRMMVSEDHRWAIYSFESGRAEISTSGALKDRVLAIQSSRVSSDKWIFTIVDRSGTLTTIRADDETMINQVDLGLGPFQGAKFSDDTLYLYRGTSIVCVDFLKGQPGSSAELTAAQVASFTPLTKERILIESQQGPVVINLKNKKVLGPPPVHFGNLPQETKLTEAGEMPERGLFASGFSNGTFRISHPRTGKPYFSINKDTGPVSGWALSLQLAVGVIVSTTGKLMLFDLGTSEVLERSTAHTESIVDVLLSENANYMVTRTSQGNCRLWELSWALTDSTSPLSIDWLPSGALNRLGMLFRNK